MDIDNLTIKDTTNALINKLFSAKELIQACLKRIKSTENKINAFITLNDKEAMNLAGKADKIIQSNKNAFLEKPLLGIPIAFKDMFSTKGLRTTAGSKALEDYVPQYDATAVRKLKEAGAIIIGKTNQDAWAHGSSGENSDFGPTKNPYDLTRVPGGSSSGSAAAVATGDCLAATGTDTGGSIRLPSAFCNLVGLKPTYGRVSRYGIVAMASSFDSIGHFTKTVYDNAKILEITAGYDAMDATTPCKEVPPYSELLHKDKPLKDLIIGIPQEYFVEGIDPKIEKITEDAIKIIESFGIKTKKISLAHTSYAMACYYILVPSEVSSNLARYDGIRYGNNRKAFGQEAKRRIMLGAYTLSSGYYDAYYKKASKVRALIRRDFEDAFKQVDAILAPVSSNPPFKIGEKVNDPLSMYLTDILTCPSNIAGMPALSVPAGFAPLPVGIQFIGPQFSEALLYQIAYKFEQETEYYKVRPKI